MTSELAKADIEGMIEEGLKPTIEDIIRLNALALKLEGARKRCAADSTEYLPRVAAISETVSFRQPTIGHEIWMDKVERFIEKGDFQSLLAVKAFALSRPLKDLPDPDVKSTLAEAVQTFCDSLQEFTRDQILAAIEYVIFGSSPLVGEYATTKARPLEECDGFEGEDWKHSLAAGVLHEGQVALWGASVAELEQMTRRQLEDMILRAQYYRDFDGEARIRDAQGRYYDTLFEIRERLKNGRA